MKSRAPFYLLIIVAFLVSCSSPDETSKLPKVDHKDLSNLHGFNLLEKFTSDWMCSPYLEKDFRLISGYGFNFVRLPIDYRCITVKGHWDQLEETAMKDVDQAIKWGEQYGIHVCINLHHAPGYCINHRDMYDEETSLWTGKSAQDAFVSLWRQMAARYKGISNDNVSFNLLNEPKGTSKKSYLAVAIRAIEAIREEDPDRLIMSDGWNVGTEPLVELVPYDVVQMFRGYWPHSITHYDADWSGNKYGPVPEWPSNQYLGQYIRAPKAGEKDFPLTVKHLFQTPAPADIEVLRVSGNTNMVVKADGKEIFRKEFNPAEDDVFEPLGIGDGGYRLAAYLDTLHFTVPEGTHELTVHAEGDDWITFGRLSLDGQGKYGKTVNIIPGNVWTSPQYPVLIKGNKFVTENAPHADWDSIYRVDHLEPWINFMKEYNIGIMVGEWGVYERAPYDVTMEWMKYMLDTWKEYNLGWAMWNFRGSFGVADVGRKGALFTEEEGMMLDEPMLEMLEEAIGAGEE